jgi:hypothetical protein
MPVFSLTPHPDSPRGPATSISVDVRLLTPAALDLRYRAAGAIDHIVAPAVASPERQDELWRHTCFEAFLRPAGSEEYFEFNFSPSTQWAGYHFDAYREGMVPAVECATPKIDIFRSKTELELRAILELRWMKGAVLKSPLQLALSAVIEEKGGAKSYWALTHAAGKPDFHHPASFVGEIKRES